MADVQSNIHVNIDTSEALASIKLLQKQISAFHASMAKSGAAASAVSANMQQNLINSLNATGKFSASMQNVRSTTESFTNALEKNKLSMRDYYRYSMGATRTFGRFFRSEFDTINKVARERVKDLQTQYIKMGRDANGAMKAIAVRPLALDMQNLGTQTQIAAQRQALLNQLLKQGSTNMLNFGKNTQWAGRQLMVGFTIPLAYLGTAAARTFMKLEEQAIRFKRVYGELFTTGEETDKMLNEVKLLAREFTKYGVTVEKTMQMAADAAAMGKMGADLLAQINESTRLAVLGGVEQELALETTISLTNTFGIAAEELANKIDFLNSVENQTVVSIEDLTEAIPKAAPVIKQLGGGVEDLAFFLTAMKEGGINASQGANALKSGLASLINPSEKAAAMLGEMGVNINAIVEANQGDVKQLVIDFASALDTLDPLNRARAIEQLFGKFQFARLSTLFQNVVQEGNQASRVLELTKATTEELAILSERELSRVEESTTYKFKKTIEDLKVTLAPVGEEFLKAITPIAEFVGNILEKFNNLGDGTKKFLVILTTLLGGIGPIFLMTFGLLANGVANLIKLFVNIKSVFNRTGQSSTILGNQTSYLTSEQLKAAAVASSLNQVHTQLRQTFTSEIAALNSLTNAYQRAIAAQRGFGGPIVGRGRKGFADGTKKVRPFYFARGTDTVPAMLTPGEAVIPAGPAQDPQNKPFIAAMISGQKLPGFMSGTASAFAHASMPFSPGSQQYARGIQIAGLEELASRFPQFIRVVSNLVVELPQKLNIAMQKGTAKASDFSKAWNAKQGKLLTSAKLGGADISNPKIKMALSQLESEIGKRTISLAEATAAEKDRILNLKKGTTKVVVSDELFAKATRSTIDDFMKLEGSAKTAAMALDASSKQLGQVRVNFPTKVIRENLASGVFRKVPGISQAGKLAQSNIMYGSTNIGRESSSKAGKFYPANPFNFKGSYSKAIKRSTDEYARSLTNAVASSLNNEFQNASPSRRMKKIGQDAARGLILGVQEYVDDAKRAGQQLGAATVQGTQAQKAAASRAMLYGGGPIDAGQKSLRRQLQKQARLQQLASKRAYTQSAMGGFVAGNVATTAAGGRGGFFGRFRRPVPTPPPADGAAPKQRMGMGGIGMGLSMAAMAGSMAPGKVGEISQKLMMPLMMLTMLGPMMKSPVGAIVVGLGAVAAAIIKLRMEFDKAQDNAMKLGESLGAGRDAIRGYAKFSGKVTAGEIMDRRSAQQFGVLGAKPGKTTFGESFIAGKEGKAMMDAARESIKTSGVAATTSNLSNQLTSSILAGALTADEAKSIALNLGQKTGNYGLGFAITAQINEIIGPNGENLEKDPLEVRMKLIEQTERQGAQLFSQLQEKGGRGGFLNMAAMNPVASIGGSALAGAGVGAAIGSFVPIPGATLVGAGIGAIAGSVGGYFAQRKENERTGAMSGAVVASQKTQMEQQKEMVDSLDIYYEKKIKELEVEGKITEAKKLQRKYDEERNTLVAKGAQLSQDIMASYGATTGNVRSAMNTGIDKALSQRYKGTDEVQYLDAAKTLLKESALTEEQQYLVKVKMSTGELTPSQQVFLFSNFGEDSDVQKRYMDIITNFSAKTADEATRVMNMFTNPDGTPNKKIQSDFIASVSEQGSDADAAKYVAFFAEVANTNGVFDMTAVITYYQNNPEVQEKTQQILDNIEKNKGNLTLDVMTNFLPPNVMGAIDADYFNKLSQDERLVYTKELATIVNIPDPVLQQSEDFQKWVKEGAKYNGVSYAGKSIGEQLAAYRQYQPWKVSEESKAQAAALKPSGNQSSGTKTPSSPLDDIVKKLRDVRKNQIKVTEGWKASFKTLDSLFGGKKKIDVFSGIEQDLRRLGAKGNFIELIVGMDPKEYEKQKKKLFKFDNKDNIIGLKKDAKTIQEALNSVVAGDFQSSLLRQQQELKDQAKAYNVLRDAGVGVAEAHELIGDAALAAMIASEGNSKSAKKLIKLYKEVQAQKEKAEARTQVREDIASRKDELNLPQIIRSQGFSTIEEMAIMSDEGLKQMAKNGQWGPVFQERLQQIFDSIEFKESLFEDGFNKAMERFSAMETKIDIDFQKATMGDQDIIEKAQDKIAGLQYQIDDWDAQLVEIEEQENKINDKYDERFKALDAVRALNEQVSKQQKGQLTLADALSQGDISAAARAAQDIRAQQASDAIDAQEKALEAAKENELASVRNTLGYTRAQIEDQIKNLRDQIFKIEEEELEPAQERVRIEEAKKRELIQSLTVLGKTKLEWEETKNKIDLAKTASDEYTVAMQAALDIVEDIVNYWESLEREFVTTHKIITIYEGGTGPNGNNGTNPKPDDIVLPDGIGDVGINVGPESLPDNFPDYSKPSDSSGGGGSGSSVIATDYTGREVNGFTPYLVEAKGEYDKIVAQSLTKGATPSDFGAQLAAADQKVINAIKLVDEKNKYNNIVQQSKSKGATPSDFGAQLAAQDTKVVNAAKKVMKSSATATKAANAAKNAKIGGTTSSVVANFLAERRARGGMITGRYALGGSVIGTDVVPSMLTPGEFVMSRYAVDNFGVDKMKAINSGTYSDASVYNYSVAVNVRSDANPDEIARAVMTQIKQVDSKRLRSNRI